MVARLDPQARPQRNDELSPRTLLLGPYPVLLGESSLPVKQRVPQQAPTRPRRRATKGAVPSRVLLGDRFHLKVTDMFARTILALLREDTPVKDGKTGAGEVSFPVQTIDILRDDIMQELPAALLLVRGRVRDEMSKRTVGVGGFRVDE